MSGLAAVKQPQQHFVPSSDVVTTIVLPTIIFCIGMVVAMLVGINKCKQWELDKIVEMRRTKRVIQRITARLREKNFNTIQKARNLRKRAKQNVVPTLVTETVSNLPLQANIATMRRKSTLYQTNPPPIYSANQIYISSAPGSSPPPTYEDSLLEQFYYECSPLSDDSLNKKARFHIDEKNRRKSASSNASRSERGKR